VATTESLHWHPSTTSPPSSTILVQQHRPLPPLNSPSSFHFILSVKPMNKAPIHSAVADVEAQSCCRAGLLATVTSPSCRSQSQAAEHHVILSLRATIANAGAKQPSIQLQQLSSSSVSAVSHTNHTTLVRTPPLFFSFNAASQCRVAAGIARSCCITRPS
jgi:hypothetical protein